MANHQWNLISSCHDNNKRFYIFEYVSEFDVNATKSLKIINININLTVHNLKTVFETFGKIIKIHFEIDHSSGISKTNALIRYIDIVSVVKAINTLNGNFFAGTSMDLVFGISSPSICVWVGGLSNSVDEFYLLRHFKNTTCCLIDQTRKHALVYFTEIISAQLAITQAHDSNLNYHKIQVDFASIDDQQEFYDHYRLVYNTENINHPTTIQIHNNNLNNFNRPNFPKPERLLSKKQQCNSLQASETNDDCSISFMDGKTKEDNINNSKNNITQITEQIIPVIENCNMFKAVNYFNSSQMMIPAYSSFNFPQISESVVNSIPFYHFDGIEQNIKNEDVDHIKINEVNDQSKITKRKKGHKIDNGSKIIKANNIKNYINKCTQNNINKLKNIQRSKKHKCQEKNENKIKYLDSTNILSKKRTRNSDIHIKKLKVDNIDSQCRISKINSSFILKIFNNKKKLYNKNQNCTYSSDEDANLDDNEYCKAINRWRTDFSLYDFELNIPVKSVYDKISVAHASCLPKKY